MNTIISIFLFSFVNFQNLKLDNLYFYNVLNNQLVKSTQTFTSSKRNVENIFSLKSEEKSRVLILDYVEVHDQLLFTCNAVSELLNIYFITPKVEINEELLKTIESKITIKFVDIINNLEDLIDSFNFYIDSEFYNYKRIEMIRSELFFTLNEIRSSIN